jgi:hypothetical protein
MPVPLVTATAMPKRLFTLALALRYASGTVRRTDRRVARELAMPQRKRDKVDKHIHTSYSRRTGDFVDDIDMNEKHRSLGFS